MLVEGDCLAHGRRLRPEIVDALGDEPFSLVANLPYQVASPLLVALLLDHRACGSMHVTIQKEVADRLLAPPGQRSYGPLTVIVRALADVQRLATVRPTCFWPVPKVTSAMVSVVRRDEPEVDDPSAFARFVTGLFGRRRKQLGSILGREIDWPPGVAAEQRPEALDVPALAALWRVVRASDTP